MSTFSDAEVEVEALLPDNTSQQITPEAMRDAFKALVDACIALEARVAALEAAP